MKQEIENLIDKLADKTLSFGCEIQVQGRGAVVTFKRAGGLYFTGRNLVEQGYFHPHQFETKVDQILGHPILIGDVLGKLRQADRADWAGESRVLIGLWEHCGFTKSLQQIFEETEWENIGFIVEENGTQCHKPDIHPKQPTHNAFFEFLLSLNLVK